VSQDGNTTRAQYKLNRFFRIYFISFDIGRAISPDVLFKSFFEGLNCTLLQHGLGNVRPSYRSLSGQLTHALVLDINTQFSQLLYHLLGPLDARDPQPPQRAGQLRV
jgi:hypothetical protein